MGTRQQLGFCPFCREAFEDEDLCPDHELELLPFDRLPKRKGAGLPRDDEPVAAYDPRFGRGLLAAAAFLLLLGFALPFVSITVSEEMTVSGFEVASRRVRSLWLVPALSAAFMSILARRRSPLSMRGVRLAVPLLALLGMSSLAYTLWGIYRGAMEMGQTLRKEAFVDPGAGVFVIALGLLLAVLSGLRLGVLPRSGEISDGGALQDDDDHIVV